MIDGMRMTRLISRWNYQQWIIESYYDDFEDLRKYFPNKSDNRKEVTATNNGYQYYFDAEQIEEASNTIKDRANELLTEFKSPIRCGDLSRSWSIQYDVNGWQAMHNHALPYKIISCVLHFDTRESENTSDGAFYAVLPEVDGTNHLHVFPYWAGKFLVLEGNIYHGAYPTTKERDIMVFDYHMEILNDPNTE